MRLALGLEYDGAAFRGWQTQAGGNTLQDALEAALTQVAAHPVGTVCAGRTDAGVHATAQVVHFDTSAQRPLGAWVRGVNAHLPTAMAVRWASAVPDDFHARFSARRRTYEYWLLVDAVRPALLARRVGWVFRPLDLAAMQAAACLLEGTHDFSAFRAAECQAASPVRTLETCRVEQRGRLIRFEVRANAFLHHMVRNLVGSLVYVGLGRRAPAWIAEVLAARDRSLAAPTFSAAGLYLSAVEYDAALALPPGGATPFE
jgi:tRNA pseudouridine38-40 synthase